jgi:CheY-like chemotaxis protein
VLIVDDDATTGLTLARVLTVQGFEASAVQSGAEGLQRALSGACDVLVLDLHLLDLPGLTVLAELRASGSDLPVVPITGHYLDEEHRRRAEALGVSAYLYKPLLDDELAQVLRRASGFRSQGPAGSIGDDRRDTDEILASVLIEAERRVRPAYPRMPREAIVDAVHDAAVERAARGDLHIVPRASLVARITAAAWRNLANAWRAEKRRRIREETYARLIATREVVHERDADYVAMRQSALLACAETDAERRAVLLWIIDSSSDAIAGALGCSHLPPPTATRRSSGSRTV